MSRRRTHEDLNRKRALLEGLARGERAVREGKILTQEEAQQKMQKWLK